MSTPSTADGRPWALIRTVGAYSGGTRVEILGGGKGLINVRVIATDEEIQVKETDLVKLRSGTP